MIKTFQSVVSGLRGKVREESPEDLANRMASEPTTLIDIREESELDAGTIPGALHLARGVLDLKIERYVPNRKTAIVLYCAGGMRSVLGATALMDMGYENVTSLEGGFRGWTEADMPIDLPQAKAKAVDPDKERYSRHVRIPEVGEAGQEKLKAAKVLLIGMGGLGCPVAMYLAAAGVGTLGLVDDDVVDVSNLQRQVLHSVSWVGMPKVESAAHFIRNLNPSVKVVRHSVRVNAENIEALFSQYDLIVDGTDNFPTRYLINDACVKSGKPCVHGSIYRFEGQITLFHPANGGPCYRCLYPEAPPKDFAPSCADAGVLGVLPGVVGLLESVEVIKVILGLGETLQGRLLTYDALKSTFGEFEIDKDPDCAVCSRPSAEIVLREQAFACATASV
jgi:sulfur-carrier protein adenylyltransferase/sulfurtransferase